MSFVHFDEMLEIILGLMEIEEMQGTQPNEKIEPVKHDYLWWEEAVGEIKCEKEEEEIYV
nr:hypothetical protein [uncultured Bacillus sp.]